MLRCRGALTMPALAMCGVLIAGCGLQISNQAEARDEWTHSYDVTPGATLEIHGANGKVSVEGTTGTRIDVRATRVVRASSDEAAKAALEQFAIEKSASADRVVLDTTARPAGLTLGISRSAEFEVKVPSGISIVIRASNGDVQVKSLGGSLRASTANGDITAANVSGPLELETTNGNIDAGVATIHERGVSCETTNGMVTLTLAKDAKARLSVRALNGSIETTGLELGAGAEPARGRLETQIGGGGPTIRIETTNGAVRVRGR